MSFVSVGEKVSQLQIVVQVVDRIVVDHLPSQPHRAFQVRF